MSEQTTRPSKPIDALTRGEFIHYRDERMDPGVVAEVIHVQPYRNGDGREMVAALFTPLAGGDPLMTRRFASHKVLMATEADVAAAVDAARRRELQSDLDALQLLLGAVEPRVEMFGRDVSFKVAAGEVERIAAELALPTAQFGGTDNIVVTWTAPGDEDRGPRLQVRFWGSPDPEPSADEVASDVKAVLAEAGRAMNATGDVEVYEPPADGEPQHRLAAGSVGGPGENSAECACGVTYAGFDTHREAAELIERHVARKAAKAKPLQVDNAIAAAEALEPKDTGRTAECGCHIFQDPLKDKPEVLHDTACPTWFFTFGSGQQFDGRYVRIRGTEFSARKRMNRVFGMAWCDQYAKLPAECEGLVLLPESEWPASVDDELADAVDRAFLPVRDEPSGR